MIQAYKSTMISQIKMSIVLLLVVSWTGVLCGKINYHELRCEVCKRTVEEIEKNVSQIDPDKKLHVGEYMLDHNGNMPQKIIEYRRSELYLTELTEQICNKMEDYVRAIMKSTGKLIVIPLIVDGMMNSIVGEAEIIQDSDLNRSLKFYCENILEEYDEGIVKHFANPDSDPGKQICWEYANLCRDYYEPLYEEDVVAAEKWKAQKKKPSNQVKMSAKPSGDMTESERVKDQLSRFPVTSSEWDDVDDEAEETSPVNKDEL